MAFPAGDSYNAVSGAVISAGRYRLAGHKRVLIWGQSNAIGRANRSDIAASPLSSDAGLATYDAATFSRVYIWTGSAFAQLNPATNNGCSAGQFGPEFGMAVRWMREASAGNLYIEKQAYSGVSITAFDPAGANYPTMKSNHISASTWLSNNAITVVDGGLLWIQGETDYTQTQGWYQPKMETLLASMQSDAIITAQTKRVLMQMAVGSADYGAGVAAAKSAVVAANPSNTVAPAAPLYMNVDNLHQNGRGQVQMGYDAFELIFGQPHIVT